ncbi:hypothetical protein DPMN_120881 [Dreissena polymorpha]|uniref:Uncharacterized protein n=1 Tax=Dreissena polymorpha TaxID=45954 RepID=A0A9D4GP53_DREPO|nr:hypothetical protein DPMN_120881 [Dreissena polymorpha]
MLHEGASTTVEAIERTTSRHLRYRRNQDRIVEQIRQEGETSNDTVGASIKKASANSVDPDETPHDAASHQGLRCLLKGISGVFTPNIYERIDVDADFHNSRARIECNDTVESKTGADGPSGNSR